MRRIYAGLCAWNLAFLVAAALTGFVGGLPPRAHALAGLFAVCFACLTHSLLLIHFIGSMWWIRQEGYAADLGDTKPLRTAWVRGPLLPAVVAASLLAVATGTTGALEGAGAWLHAALGVLNVPATLCVLRLALRALNENDRRIREVARRARDRRERGEVHEAPAEALLPESGRAGGKVFLWLSLNVWLLWAYLRLVLRRPEALWPYAVASAALLAVGLWMLRASGPATDGVAGPVRRPPGYDEAP